MRSVALEKLFVSRNVFLTGIFFNINDNALLFKGKIVVSNTKSCCRMENKGVRFSGKYKIFLANENEKSCWLSKQPE